ADEFAVHHRQAPEAPLAELLAELKRVAEEAQVAADAKRTGLIDRQAVVARGRWTGEDALADAIDDGFLKCIAAEGEEEQTDTGPAVGSLLGRQLAFDAGLGIAADDGGSVAGGGLSRDARPVGSLGGHDETAGCHRERL